jgi:hypothetical protein
LSTVAQMMIGITVPGEAALRLRLKELHRTLSNVQCALECLSAGTESADLRGTLELLGDVIGDANEIVHDLAGDGSVS